MAKCKFKNPEVKAKDKGSNGGVSFFRRVFGKIRLSAQDPMIALLRGALALLIGTSPVRAGELFYDDFLGPLTENWRKGEGEWNVKDGQAVATSGFATMYWKENAPKDFEVAADVAYEADKPYAAAGIQFRIGPDATGYGVCLREVEKGIHPEFGPWERPVLQLFRMDQDGWKLLQESKVMDCRSGWLRRIKVACHGPDIFVYYQDLTAPVFKEYDERYVRSGRVGLWKDQKGTGIYQNFSVTELGVVPQAPLRTDWSWVKGAVYVRSDAVNSVEMWHDYWDHTEVLDRELSYAALYGFNMIQVYLHWIVWDQHKQEYLKRIDDFLARAAKYKLKVNLILWDDCGNVEPSVAFADPVPGRHNSQMMPNPSHRIRDNAAEMNAHKERFREYIEGIAGRFKNDDRIAFWQLYNECMGPKERYRQGEADTNLNRLLGWTRDWVKGTGTQIPVTATGGGFYGPKYSDFYSYHSYRNDNTPLPNADGGPEHICTETLDRPKANMADCLHGLAGKGNGLVVWELMIGRDNCRFPWRHPDGTDEPAVPFHGVIYPDGHPWDAGEINSLLGDAAFASLGRRVFNVEYFQGRFATAKKTSITPRIEFDLGGRYGDSSPDASVGLGKEDFSIRWTGEFATPQSGTYTFFCVTDGAFQLWIDDTQVLNKIDQVHSEVHGKIELAANQPYRIKAEYSHQTGRSSACLSWSGPRLEKQIFLPSGP